MTDIALLYPPVAIKGRYIKVATGHEVPPQPLIYLAAVLRKHNFKCSIIDANALGLDEEATVDKILSVDPRIVGITAPTMLISAAARIARALKDKNPDLLVVVGGPHMSAEPEETMSLYPSIDIGVRGEGEVTLIELLDALNKKNDLSGVKGIIFRSKNALCMTAARPYIEDLDTLPMPAWDMLPDILTNYQQSASRIYRLPNMSVVTSRGCPFQCIFCARNVFGNVTRAHSAGYVIAMVRHLIKHYKIRSISFEDENFVVYKKRLVEFCNHVIREKIDISWDAASSITAVTPELLCLMKKAGCWQLNYGIESGSQRILDFIKKGTTVEGIKRTLAMTKKAGIITKGYFIIGHPTEDELTIRETIRFIRSVDLDIFQMSFMVPFPGTELSRIASRYGSVINSIEDMNIWTPLFIPHGLTEEKLIQESKRAYRAFYLRARPIAQYLRRALRPDTFGKFLKDGFKIFKFIVGKE